MNAITIALYLGIYFIIFGFILFIYSEMKKRDIDDRELIGQEQLHKSFMNGQKTMKAFITARQ